MSDVNVCPGCSLGGQCIADGCAQYCWCDASTLAEARKHLRNLEAIVRAADEMRRFGSISHEAYDAARKDVEL